MNFFKTLYLLVGFLLILAECGRNRSTQKNDKDNDTDKNHNTNNNNQKKVEPTRDKAKQEKFYKNKKLNLPDPNKPRLTEVYGEDSKKKKTSEIKFTKCDLQVKKCYDAQLAEKPKVSSIVKDSILLDCAEDLKCDSIKLRICVRKEVLKMEAVLERCQNWGY